MVIMLSKDVESNLGGFQQHMLWMGSIYASRQDLILLGAIYVGNYHT